MQPRLSCTSVYELKITHARTHTHTHTHTNFAISPSIDKCTVPQLRATHQDSAHEGISCFACFSANVRALASLPALPRRSLSLVYVHTKTVAFSKLSRCPLNPFGVCLYFCSILQAPLLRSLLTHTLSRPRPIVFNEH